MLLPNDEPPAELPDMLAEEAAPDEALEDTEDTEDTEDVPAMDVVDESGAREDVVDTAPDDELAPANAAGARQRPGEPSVVSQEWTAVSQSESEVHAASGSQMEQPAWTTTGSSRATIRNR